MKRLILLNQWHNLSRSRKYKEIAVKSLLTIVGIILIIFGIGSIAYQNVHYTKQEKIGQVAGIQVTADTEKTMHFPPALGFGSLAAGIILVFVGRKRG
jgi:uncharacterized membrane protein